MSVEKEIELLGENFKEIVGSAAAVKGEGFAQAVGAQFEALQLVEIVGRLRSIAKEEYQEYAADLAEAATSVMSSITIKACGDIEPKQFDEAISLAETMYDRRNRTIETIKKGMEDAD